MSNKGFQKNAYISRCHSTGYSTSLRRILLTIYDRAVSRGIVHTSYREERCNYTGWSQECHMTPQLPHVSHTAHIVLCQPPSNLLTYIAAQWHSTLGPVTSQGLWGLKPSINLGGPRVPSPDHTPPGSDLFTTPECTRLHWCLQPRGFHYPYGVPLRWP